ncbi:heterokaryon incompatibility protein-domain-containing protein [Dactylonectria macrodidyma]|uniref:Heterokaryon incompatibility protein-domain-containing protein n=1 Tax=Dactylonectria macrodidyma TaxID=307937 RepID=A0A9P9DXA5_9HYPO|nr:heterokaryon incompatibility protein-domain-containing protein [Dactylonectria macrodidyma]
MSYFVQQYVFTFAGFCVYDHRIAATMAMYLVLNRGCRHLDWCTIPDTNIEFCKSCGFALVCAASVPADDAYKEVQAQPNPLDTFPEAPHSLPDSCALLKPGQSNDALRCELEPVNLQQGPIYEAVSYTWADEIGDDSICKTIQCGDEGRLIGITKNCEKALLRLRKLDTDRRLWVDAVCIDQSNVLERNHQVNNMIAIFRSAIRVLVFLGEGHPVLGRLIDYISNDTGGRLPLALDFITLFQSRWFYRLIEHGNVFLRLMAAGRFSLVLPPVISHGLRQTNLGARRIQGKSDLLSLLQISRNCSCKDARDKVYAITGLLQGQTVLPLRADYSTSTSAGWVFLQVAAWHIAITGSLEMLAQVDGKSAMNMPSWVPDWTKPNSTSLLAQLKVVESVEVPQLHSSDGRRLLPTAALNYPLSCVLLVTGRRCGSVWTDARIFGGTFALKRSIEDYMLGQREISGTATLGLSDLGGHWLHRPSQNHGTWRCSS